MAESRLFRFLVLITLATSLALIITSSLMHVGNVGMGSPDWPAAYGLIIEHGASIGGEANTAAAILPTAAIERAHRAIASTLLLLIIAVVMMVLRQRKASDLSVFVPMMALGLALFLALLGVWFGSPLRYPAVVILNLTGGIGLLALFWWLTLDIYAGPKQETDRVGNIRVWAVAGLLALIIEIVLGVWTDAYYAALACTSFPDCHGQWWPGMKLAEGLGLLGTLDVDAHGKVVIDGGVAAAIHMAHRLGALLAFVVIAGLGIRAWGMGGRCRMAGAAVLFLLVIQVVLGVAAVIADLPMAVVASHSSLSAVMVISILTLVHRGWSGQRQGAI
jgi:cytochrome c oxidase assembly protein subunit 15